MEVGIDNLLERGREGEMSVSFWMKTDSGYNHRFGMRGMCCISIEVMAKYGYEY